MSDVKGHELATRVAGAMRSANWDFLAGRR